MSIVNYLKKYSGTLNSIGTVLTTGALQQSVSLFAFQCPCASYADLDEGCDRMTTLSWSCVTQFNFAYGISFVLAPALVLYLFAFVSFRDTRKTIMGCLYKTKAHKRKVHETALTLCEVTSKALLPALTWICVALLEGDYFACAITPIPFDVGETEATYKDCQGVANDDNPTLSEAFVTNRAFSQLFGWIIISVLFTFCLIVHCVFSCTFPLTHYQATYYRVYKMAEEEEFESEMVKQARLNAAKNVSKFFGEIRSKELWDKISTVCSLTKDEKSIDTSIFSNLQEWALEQSENDEKNEDESRDFRKSKRLENSSEDFISEG